VNGGAVRGTRYTGAPSGDRQDAVPR
jgi:hypothetical protein